VRNRPMLFKDKVKIN